MGLLSQDEEKLVILIIVAIRYGLAHDSIEQFVSSQLRETSKRNRCFMRALEYSEKIDTICGTGEHPVSLIVEHVKLFNQDSQGSTTSSARGSPIIARTTPVQHEETQTATVIKRYERKSATEVSISRLGLQVQVINENDMWSFIEIPDSGECGWVPHDVISYNERT